MRFTKYIINSAPRWEIDATSYITSYVLNRHGVLEEAKLSDRQQTNNELCRTNSKIKPIERQ